MKTQTVKPIPKEVNVIVEALNRLTEAVNKIYKELKKNNEKINDYTPVD